MTATMPVPDLTESDPPASASLANLVDHLTGPLGAGAVLEQTAFDAAGTAHVDWIREPLLLLRLETDLGMQDLDVVISLTASGGAVGGTFSTTARFAAFSEQGACLAIHPTVSAPPGSAGPGPGRLDVVVTLTLTDEVTTAAVAPVDVASIVGLVLSQGVIGRLGFVMSAEKAGIRRAAREIAASRTVRFARRSSLDRHGLDLSVPRFTDRLIAVPSPGPAGTPPEVSTAPRTEPDGLENDIEYRRRLTAMRTVAIPTGAGVRDAMNGPGAPADPPQGWLGELGAQARFTVADQTDAFAVGVLVVPTGDQAELDGFLNELRRDRLVRPTLGADPPSDYSRRMMTTQGRLDLVALGNTLLAWFAFADADPAMASGVADCLALAARIRRVLGDAGKWNVTRTQDANGGNRYQLGLGVDVTLPDAGAAETLRQAMLALDLAALPGAADASLRGVLTTAQGAAGTGTDPQLRWLWDSCGFRTIHPVDASTLYLSHLPIFGMEVTATGATTPVGWTHLVALPLTTSTFARYDPVARTLQIVSVLPDGSDTVLGTATGLAMFDHLVALPLGRSGRSGTSCLLLGFEKASGTAHFLLVGQSETSVAATGLQIGEVLSQAGWGSGWTSLTAGWFGGSDIVGDLVLFDRATGRFAVHRFDGRTGFVAGGPNGDGQIGGGGIGRWTHLVPGRFGRPTGAGDAVGTVEESGESDASSFSAKTPGTDQLLCYDSHSGDLQLLEPDGARGLSVRWRISGWRPGYTHLQAVSTGGGAAQLLLAHDRERGGLDQWIAVADGAPVLLRQRALPSRSFTHWAFPPLLRDWTGTPAVLVYDRARGTAAVWSLVGSAHHRFPSPRRSWHAPSLLPLKAELRAENGLGGEGHAVLVESIDAAVAAWTADGHPAWALVSDHAAQQVIWASAADPGAVGPILAAAGLTAAPAGGTFAAQAAALPSEYVATLTLDATTTAVLAAGGTPADDVARELSEVLSAQGLASAVSVVDAAGSIAIVVSVTGLPGAGLNLSGRRSAGFRWYALPVRGYPGVVRSVGASSSFSPAQEGLTALVVLGYRRGGLADPYEVLLELPAGAVLTLEQYEFALNVVERAVPAGIEVNTFGIRRRHLDLDGDGIADPLPPTAAQMYRRFRRRTR